MSKMTDAEKIAALRLCIARLLWIGRVMMPFPKANSEYQRTENAEWSIRVREADEMWRLTDPDKE